MGFNGCGNAEITAEKVWVSFMYQLRLVIDF